MLNKVDGLVASLEQKEKEIAEIRTREGRTEAEQERDAENLVTFCLIKFESGSAFLRYD